MSYKSDKELADRLDAEERLEAKGYVRKSCQTCSQDIRLRGVCPACGGKGYTWVAPMVR